MKIIHRVSFNPTDAQRREMSGLGLEWEEAGVGVVVFLIEEGSRAWAIIAPMIAQWDALDMVSTEFTKKELIAADYLLMEPSWHHGYPQPEDSFGYRGITYDSTEYCADCGIGGTQRAPFRMIREPKWGSRRILQLNWVFDEFFVTPESWTTVFKPFGIESLPVLHHKTGRPLELVVQLQVSSLTTSAIITSDIVPEVCVACNNAKLGKRLPGRFPHVEMPEGSHIAKTIEYFGSGAKAFREIIISAALYKAITAAKLKGASFQVVARSGEPRV